MEKLVQEDIEAQMEQYPDWSLNGEALQRTFAFDDFLGAVAFVSRVADLAEEFQHHPDILIRYNKVTLTTTTHDAGGLTVKDFDLARALDSCIAAT